METLDNIEYNIGSAFKIFPQKGNLVYEYNPFYNYRLDETMLYYKNRLWTFEEFCNEFELIYEVQEGTSEYVLYKKGDKTKITNWSDIIPATETQPIVYQKGLLVDFETDELSFSLNNPVQILPQYSYDNSVNLVLNDGLNPPRIINSRWSATERNKYQVCNRKGNNDSNIYDRGEQFDIDTSLYKKITSVPELKYLGISYGGNLLVGNYHFYFRYIDEDGNMSDFIELSGLVSIFIGNSCSSIRQGFRDENSYKLVKFSISNLDSSYTKLIIYYTRATGDVNQDATVAAYKIDKKYLLNNDSSTIITITGFENKDEVTIEEINPTYQIYGSAETQATVKNMLFLANVDKLYIDNDDFADCALRFVPYLDSDLKYNTTQIGTYYNGSITNTYYDPDFIYNYTGYHYDEIYRFGIVFILKDNTLSPVYNVRGIGTLPTFDEIQDAYSNLNVEINEDSGNRKYIEYDEFNYILKDNESQLENAKGVVRFPSLAFNTIAGINFAVPTEIITYLQENLEIKGFFFVRLKRIPTTLCQAYTIGIDKESYTPVIPDGDDYITESFISKYVENKKEKDDEDDNSRLIEHSLSNRIRTINHNSVRTEGAICPEYDINSPYFNSLFTGTDFICKTILKCTLNKASDDNYFYFNAPTKEPISEINSVKIIGVEDNSKLVEINGKLFSARAGEAEEAFRYEYIGEENKTKKADNLLRGSYGPYLGIVGLENSQELIDIKIPGYKEGNIEDYFMIRYDDKSPFYPISYKYDILKLRYFMDDVTIESISYKKLSDTLYRGDCYICQFTHRLNRNFQDPSAPTNDKIVDPKCWKENYDFEDGVLKVEDFDKINLGDLNAVKLGLYITVHVRSTYNLNVRAIDESNVDEYAMFGHGRSFYPFSSMSNAGSYKIPEALCVNKGYEKSLSERMYFELEDVPWIKNEFSNRIAYSKIEVKDQFLNGWRTFEGTHYRDYSKQWGSITKILDYRDNLLCVFEHGICLISVNERAVAAEGGNGLAYINTSNVLPETPNVISGIYGSQWKDSIISTDIAVYGVDTVARKIWRTNGSSFECISDFKIQEFLNQNISLTERELDPTIGIKNVKTHFNRYKLDVMFTFYDNLYGFEERAWNLCFNESLLQWITFYSWIPSYSENIHNLYYSFDRNTSKWIAKLGVSHSDNDFSDGVCLSNNIIDNNVLPDEDGNVSYEIGKLSLENRTLPTGTNVTNIISFELVHDDYLNYKKFEIKHITEEDKEGYYLYLKVPTYELCSELYQRGTKDENGNYIPVIENTITIPDNYNYIDDNKKEENEQYNCTKWINNCILNDVYYICKNERSLRINLNEYYNLDKIVTLLNIRANILTVYDGIIADLADAYATGSTDSLYTDAGYYETVVAVIPKYNMQFLTTDFWRHGQAGIIDIADKIQPTYWYGKQHPFEFEFVVADEPNFHKIFDNLEIISNNAEPESFHYEIIGDSYDFAKDKKNMYIRQEATKEIYQYNGVDTTYDHDYTDLNEEHREIEDGLYDKSTIMPLYYSRQDTINEIEDYYHLKDGINTEDFSRHSGGEIVHYDNLDEYRIWNHTKAVSINDEGRLNGNMQYKEDTWHVLINPLNIVLNNESAWENNLIPVELLQCPVPDEIKSKNEIEIPDDWKRGFTSWGDYESQLLEAKIKDKWIKVRIRYTGNKLAIIQAVITMYSISYS